MEEYQTVKDIKEEVVDCGFVEVDSQDVYQLCTACLCTTRTTRTLSDDALKQYYMHILAEMQLEGGVAVSQSPRLCWECAAHLKRSVRFREQVQDSYRLLQPMLSMCDKEDLDEFLQTSVCRPGRLKIHLAHSISMSPLDDVQHDHNYAAASRSVEDNVEGCSDIFHQSVATVDEEAFESFCDRNIVVCVAENVKTHTDKIPLQFKVYDESFFINGNMLDHSRTHFGEKPFQCEVCDKSFTRNGKMRVHLRTHTGEKPFRCDVCHKSFSRKNSLQSHLSTHTGEKPFQCEVCHKPFSYKHSMLSHVRTHTGEKHFQCEVCCKSFYWKASLQSHLRTHTGEKPFQCEICHKSFSHKSTLRSHLIRHNKYGL